MKNGKMRSDKSVAALMHAVARKLAFRLMHRPVVMLKSQYFAIGWQTQRKPNAASMLFIIETNTTA